MKNWFLAMVLSMVVSFSFAQTIEHPSFSRQDDYSITIDKVELSASNTFVYCTHTAPNTYANGGWVRMDPNIFLRDNISGRKYRLVKAEGIPLAPNKFTYSYAGQKLSFRLVFPKLSSEVRTVDMIECEGSGQGCFNFYGLRVGTSSGYTPSETQSYSGYERAGRKFLRDKIGEWGSCKNVAMTMTGGDIALSGTNGWASKGVPAGMTDKLTELHDDNKLIDDIVLTENGSWLILFGVNGISASGAPDDLWNKLKKWNNEGEVITSVTYNDMGDWIAITKDKYSASSDKVMDYIREGESQYGEFWAAHLTNDGLVLCYARGYKFLGNVPENLKKKLSETRLNVFRIKFLPDGCYFIADFNGQYAYNM